MMYYLINTFSEMDLLFLSIPLILIKGCIGFIMLIFILLWHFITTAPITTIVFIVFVVFIFALANYQHKYSNIKSKK